MSHRRASWLRRMAMVVAAMVVAVAGVVGAGAVGADTPARAAPQTASISDPQQGLEQLNRLRAVAGLPAVTGDAALSAGAQAHARYSVETGTVGHTQDPSNPFASTAGAESASRSNVALWTTGSRPIGPRGIVDMLQVAPFHGLLHLQPQLARSGVGYAADGTREALVVDVRGGVDASIADPPHPIAFPGPGATTNLRSYTGGEYPDPLGPCAGWTAPTGAPILLTLPDPGEVHEVSITGPDAQPLATCWFDAARFHHGDAVQRDLGRAILRERNALVVLPREPLATGRHRVTVDLDGADLATWTFTVGDRLGRATGWVQQRPTTDPDLDRPCPAAALDPLPFDDVRRGVHTHAIACGVAWGFVSGTTATTFSPADAVTRGQSASLLHRLLAAMEGAPAEVGPSIFSDVAAASAHHDAIAALTQREIIEGRTDGTFGPEQPVTRAQFVTTLARLLTAAGEHPTPATTTSRFDDVQPGSIHHAAVEHLAALGIVTGVTATAFDPDAEVRRDQAAALLVRTAVLLADDGTWTPPN